MEGAQQVSLFRKIWHYTIISCIISLSLNPESQKQGGKTNMDYKTAQKT